MSAATNGQKEARKGRLGLGTWPDVVAAFVAVLTLLGAIIGGIWGWDWVPGRDSRDVTAPLPSGSAAPPATTPAATPTPTPSSTAAAPPAGVPLDSLTPVAGRTVPLPAGLDPAKYPHAVAVGCPSNQTADSQTVLKYQLFGRYRTLTGTLSGWSATAGQGFRVQLTVVTGTKQPDDQIQSERRPAVTVAVNAAPASVRTDIAAFGDAGRDGKGADEVELRFTCEQPHDAVILSGAVLGR